MDAHALWSLSPVAFEARRESESAHRTIDARAGALQDGVFVDLDGRSVALPVVGRRVVTAWFLDVKPRRDATVVALGRGAWRDGQPNASAQAQAAALIERGVGVLLVDVRRASLLSSRWTGCKAERIVRTAVEYLEDRGYDAESIDAVRVD